MIIAVNLTLNFPGLIDFQVTFSQEIPGGFYQQIQISGAFPENDESLRVLRQKAQVQATSILRAFAAQLPALK